MLKNSLPLRRRAIAIVLLGLCFILSSRPLAAAQPISYAVDLTHPESHLVGVTMTAPHAHAETEIQFPAWNALYQIRDFVPHVQGLLAECNGEPLTLQPVDLYTFRTGSEACSPLVVRYQVFAREPGVFSSELIPDHAFLNLAEILFYIPGERSTADRARFILPPEWNLITFLAGDSATETFTAADYDALVDSPAEAGLFQLYSYTQAGALYRIAVRGEELPARVPRGAEDRGSTTATLAGREGLHPGGARAPGRAGSSEPGVGPTVGRTMRRSAGGDGGPGRDDY